MWKMWCNKGRQVQAEKMSWLYWNRDHGETGGEKIFRLRLRLFSKKIISPHQTPASIIWQGLLSSFPSHRYVFLTTQHCLNPSQQKIEQGRKISAYYQISGLNYLTSAGFPYTFSALQNFLELYHFLFAFRWIIKILLSNNTNKDCSPCLKKLLS